MQNLTEDKIEEIKQYIIYFWKFESRWISLSIGELKMYYTYPDDEKSEKGVLKRIEPNIMFKWQEYKYNDKFWEILNCFAFKGETKTIIKIK